MAVINRERKGFGLKPLARKPKQTDLCVSSTVSVIAADEAGFCYIRFDPKFVDFIGHKMPRGVARFDPCFLEVTEEAGGWRVDAVYVRDGLRRALWVSDEKPAWVGTLRQEKGHGSYTEKPESQGSATGG